ncbi:hypothetical protein HDU87_001710 [Geranomyces variabilis]|uniref:Uncharacterized protein n=1 Tax=Geranomyces variabilis TaxID=109894 RepID=A0AAD5XL74_9FUNG|nr:hypothetical protein HDU87_001710 [Geranomyces variabilis]
MLPVDANDISAEELQGFLSDMFSAARLKELVGQVYNNLDMPELEQAHTEPADNDQAHAVFHDRINGLLADLTQKDRQIAEKDRRIAELAARLEGH